MNGKSIGRLSCPYLTFVGISSRSILNYHNIDDPWDVDGNGIFKYAHSQVTNEALIVADDYCIVAGTDTNYPWTNQFELEESQVPDWQEVSDARFMVVCFVEPIFSVDYIEKLMVRRPKTTTAAPTDSPPGTPEASPTSAPDTSSARTNSVVLQHVLIGAAGGFVLA